MNPDDFATVIYFSNWPAAPSPQPLPPDTVSLDPGTRVETWGAAWGKGGVPLVLVVPAPVQT